MTVDTGPGHAGEGGFVDDRDYLQGQLLIAMPNLREGCFRESVVLICSHDANHAMGLILNKTISDLTFADLLRQVDLTPSDALSDRPIFFGGPVDTRRGVVLHSGEYRQADTVEITAGISLTATRDVLQDLNEPEGLWVQGRQAPQKALICAGHAGWAAGQLEHELAQNAWLNMPAEPELVFPEDPDTVWETALSRLGIDASMFSAVWSETREPDGPLN